MGASLSQLNDEFRELLLQHFRASSSAAADQPFLAFELGTPIPDETFHLPADNPAYSPAVALEYMSHHANIAPRVQDGVLLSTSNRLDGLYEIVLLGATPVSTVGLELLEAVKRSARAEFEDTLGSSIPPGIGRFRPVHAQPINWYDQGAAANWTLLKVDHSDEPPPAPPPPPAAPPPQHGIGGGSSPSPPPPPGTFLMWHPVQPELRELLGEPASVKNVERFKAAASVSHELAVNDEVALAPAARLRGPLVEHLRLERPQVAVRRPGLGEHFGHITRDALVLHGPLHGPAAPAPPAPAPTPVASDGFSISVEVCLVHLRRPWISDALLTLNNWFVPSMPKGSLSAGQGQGDATPLSVLPVACVCIRNLTIKARWTDSDQQALQNSSHLGSFSLLGRSFDHNSATLTVPGMQSIAWICDPLPVLPPADAPQ